MHGLTCVLSLGCMIVVLVGCAAEENASAESEVVAQPVATQPVAQPVSTEPILAEPEVESAPVFKRERPEQLFAPLDLPTPSRVRLGSGAPGPDYWQQRVDYTIDARLDAESKRLSADMTIRYHNNSEHTLTYMWLQLEQNLFRDDSIGTVSRDQGGVMRAADEALDGGYTITEVRSGDEVLELTVYDTLARLDLGAGLGPGEVFSFSMHFEFDMPPHLRRMGSEEVEQGTIFEYAQWFPHVCVYDDVHGWNTLPYLGTGEFYTNFGSFDVSITVPADHVVAATGELMNPEDVLTPLQLARLEEARSSDETVMIRTVDEVGGIEAIHGTKTWRFQAEDVRTFAWATSEAFIWDACRATVIDLDGNERDVLCQSVYPVEADAWFPDADLGGSSQYVKHSVEFYSDWLFPYPYPQMTNVNGPEGGMEYPMIIFCGGRTRGPQGVTDHEVGHTWFPMIVNTDERRHIWMDEGFNTFINMYSRAAFYNNELTPGRAMRQTLEIARSVDAQPIATAPDRMYPRWVGRLGYRKTGMGMYLLREVVIGPERFDRAFGEYIRRWAFKSPQPADFFRTMEDAAGMDLAWFFRQWFYETGALDQAVGGVEVSEDTAMITIHSLGEQVMPLSLLMEFDDGTTERRELPVQIWHYTNERVVTVPVDDRSLVKVSIDPDEILPDIDLENNTWTPR